MHDSGPHLDPGDHLLATPHAALLMTPERALYWAEGRTLFVADLHIGKAAVFRARGIPVPQGTTTETLQRLSCVLRRTGAQQLVVLGDFLHARESQAAPTLAALRWWRQQHRSLHCVVIQGNHDRHAGQLDEETGFALSTQPYRAAKLVGVHDPAEGRALDLAHETLVLAGHVHPVVTIKGRLDSLRLPCFWLNGQVLTLPAFGAFTGGYAIDARDTRVFVVSDRAVTELPRARTNPGPA